jgi:serine/threonine-protein kinase RsbW
MNNEVIRLTMPAHVDGMKGFCAFVRKGAEAADLSPFETDKLDLVLEELFMNIARHAYAPEQGEVEVGYTVEGQGRLLVQISDSGRAFNPLESDLPSFSGSLADRRLGGMGILLVRKMAGSLRYQRNGDRNQVSFEFPAATQ